MFHDNKWIIGFLLLDTHPVILIYVMRIHVELQRKTFNMNLVLLLDIRQFVHYYYYQKLHLSQSRSVGPKKCLNTAHF
jgi:hypothetical protein